MKITWKFLFLLLFAGTLAAQTPDLKGKKVFYICSYHVGFVWSDSLEKALTDVLKPTGVEIKTVWLDTYRQKSPEHLAQVVAECKAVIETWKPDIVIMSEDAAVKSIYAPFFKEADLPFVFCGVNWDATAYGVPNKNITGMLEVCPIKDLLAEMIKLKPGKTIGYLGSDTLTSKKDAERCASLLGADIKSLFAKDFAAWQKDFLELQATTDLVVIGLNLGISDWDETAGRKFAEENTKVVTGSFYDFVNGLALISYNKLAGEQGDWAAKAAVRILQGAKPGSIPIASNQGGELVINARIAKNAGVTPSFETLQNAKVIE